MKAFGMKRRLVIEALENGYRVTAIHGDQDDLDSNDLIGDLSFCFPTIEEALEVTRLYFTSPLDHLQRNLGSV